MIYLTTTEETSVEELAQLLTKELNKMLEIKTKLLTSFYLQIDSQIKRMNQELEQYL